MMKKLVFGVLLALSCTVAHAFDVAYAPTKAGILIITNDECKAAKPHAEEVKILVIRHESKSGIVNGCYMLTPDGKMTAEFENGQKYEYRIDQFIWTPEAYDRLKKII
jgi:hypothetical protein